jgi:hypothetical protein
MKLEEFIFCTPLYYKVKDSDFEELFSYISGQTDQCTIDGYNPVSKIDTTYQMMSCGIDINRIQQYGWTGLEPLDRNVRLLSFRCSRKHDILSILVRFNLKEKWIYKIGSYPSLADFKKKDLKKYSKVLSDLQMKELLTAITVASNGVGIGSYVYLRRIFEEIVLEEGQRAISDGVVTSDEFSDLHMDKKIKAIKDYLPDFLITNARQLYSILSKGIHELQEQECLSYFEVLLNSIEIILDQRISQRVQQLKQNNAQKELNKIFGNLTLKRS